MDLIVIASLIFSAATLVLVLYLFAQSRKSLEGPERMLREEIRAGREESARAARELREEVTKSHNDSARTVVETIDSMGRMQRQQLETVARRVGELSTSNEQRLDAMRTTVDENLKQLSESNEKKLDEMRKTVDEKLQSTLEKRLGESFKLVSDHLEAVQRGLGEMQSLATGVGDLKRVLTNVKTRGILGEVMLGDILEQILTPDQYATNVATRPGAGERVEFAIRLPGLDDHPDSVLWLPVDAKFPQEDLHRLEDAAEVADAEGIKKARADLMRSVEASAKDISDKYVCPPHTTDFAIMFLATENLYAEVLRQPGFVQKLQHDYRVHVAGPTTLAAFVNSLRMGFRTLAIEQRSSEVWQILAAVKTEFGKFGEVLARVKKQLDTASNTIDKTATRTSVMAKKLKSVEALPSSVAHEVLNLPAGDPAGDAEAAGEELLDEELEAPV